MIELIGTRFPRSFRLDDRVYPRDECEVIDNGENVVVIITSDDVERILMLHDFTRLPSEIFRIDLPTTRPFREFIDTRVSLENQGNKHWAVLFTLEYQLNRWSYSYSIDNHQKILSVLLQEEGLDCEVEGSSTLEVRYSDRTRSGVIPKIIDLAADILTKLDKRAEKLLLATGIVGSVVASFNFPEQVRTSCEQYLLYFVQFLKDLGVEADAALTHRAGQVLFSVTPKDDRDALDNIRHALEEYLSLPASPIANSAQGSIEQQRLEANILRLHGDLKLAAAELQAKNTTIQAQQLILDVQKGLLSGEVSMISKNQLAPTPEEKEDLITGVVALSTYKDKGVEIHLGEVLRRLKKKFARTDK